MTYRAKVNNQWLHSGKLWDDEVYACQYANPVAAHLALRRFVGKRRIKGARYFVINEDGSVFAEFHPDGIPKGISIKLSVECDGSYQACGGGYKCKSKNPYTAARNVIRHWREAQA